MKEYISYKDSMQFEYKKIKIQDLEERKQTQATAYSEQSLCFQLNRSYAFKNALYYKDSGLPELRIVPKNGVMKTNCFFSAFLQAYVNHGNVAMIPDEVWLMIMFYVSKYVQEHAEALREKIVRHEGVKTLTVVEEMPGATKEQAEQAGKKWDSFFQQIIGHVKENTIEGVTQLFECDFSTTTQIYRTISTALVMNSFQQYFKYRRNICVCGIGAVYMAGCRQDWASMVDKLNKLEQFDVDGKLKQYIHHMNVILIKFLETFDGAPDVQWWNHIMKDPQTKKVYGGSQTEVSGWILHFIGLYNKTKIGSFPDLALKLPITLVDKVNEVEKHLFLVADWVSVSKVDEATYKPDVAVGISVATITALK